VDWTKNYLSICASEGIDPCPERDWRWRLCAGQLLARRRTALRRKVAELQAER